MCSIFAVTALYVVGLISYLFSLVVGFFAKDALTKGDWDSSEEIFPVFLIMNFVIGVLLGLATSALILNKFPIRNFMFAISMMASSASLGGLVMVALRVRWQFKLMEKFNSSN